MPKYLGRYSLLRVWSMMFGQRSLRDTWMSNADAMLKLGSLLDTYVPWTSSAMQPNAVVMLCNDVIINRRRTVLEFGSGLSTLHIAAALKQIDAGMIFSIDHDADWIAIMQGMVDAEGLGEFVKFVHAPLTVSRYAIRSLDWYCEQVLLQELGGHCFDLVVIDGPLAYRADLEMSRYPAIPFVFNNQLLNERFMLVLDDANRHGEKQIIKKWAEEMDINFVVQRNLGVATFSNSSHFNI